ncbi:MAG: stage V sporulation protein E [Firmicutes bacterium]|nr:stage V sporulation protein E [Bacillota bacterium]
MKRKGAPDSLLILATFVLLAIGLVMVYSSSSVNSLYLYGISYYYLRRQFIFVVLGLAAMFVCMNFNYWQWRRFVKLFFFINFILLGLVLIPGIGVARTDAQRWIDLGFMRFQPSDFTKFALVLFTANYLVVKREMIQQFRRGLLPVLLITGLNFGLIMLQPDLGTGLAIVGSIVVMLFGAGVNVWHLIGLAAAAIPGIVALIWIAPYRLMRLLIFTDPWRDPTQHGWQIIQSLLAIGSGGFAGVGLGASRQKYLYLPEPWNDFIFAIICEEMGFIGGATVILLFLILIWRGFRIAMNAPDSFGQFLALGLTAIIAVQASINIGVVTGSLPVTGINLPLISYGGSSLLITLGCIGILLNISRYSMNG